jgi:hypothetical protein
VPIITLTSDLGLRDSYIPSVKGFLLGRSPSANIVDITHLISPFNIAEASFILSNCYADFPPGTMHLISVDANTQTLERFLLAEADGQWFFARDNGLISLFLPANSITAVYELPFSREHLVFPMKNILAPAAVKLVDGLSPVEFAVPTERWLRLANQQPISNEKMLRGTVQYVDNMGNAVTNILRSQIGDRKCRVYVNRSEYFDEINDFYNEVEEGEKICLFNSAGRLEIAINKGSAGGLLGLKTGANILVEFL